MVWKKYSYLKKGGFWADALKGVPLVYLKIFKSAKRQALLRALLLKKISKDNAKAFRSFKRRNGIKIRKGRRKAVGKLKKGIKMQRAFTLVILIFSLSMIISLSLYHYIKLLPNPKLLREKPPNLTTKIFSRNGTLLYKIYKDENRTLVHLNDISPQAVAAFLAMEDTDFYKHRGISIKGILRAAKKNVEEDAVLYGGSTITQQLVKNRLLSPEKTFKRKIKEAILALWTERVYSKDEILEMYLNEVGFGGTAYGIEEASQYYFNANSGSLSLAQGAMLAGLPSAPSAYSPFYNFSKARTRQKIVLKRMLDLKIISKNEYGEALKEEIKLAPIKDKIIAPHFVMFVREKLEKEYGKDMVERGGLSVTTSLDLKLQKLAEEEVEKELERIKRLHATNGAVLITNPQNGEILAMVGSRNYFDSEKGGYFNVTTALRQPGSAIKPIMYSLALTKGFTASTIIYDSPISFPQENNAPFRPVNYDRKFHGPVRLRQALANSFNVPAVKVLNKIGVENFLEFGRKCGITTWEDSSRYGLSITLGGGEVKMVDMAVAYGMLANGGIKKDLNPIIKVVGPNGKDITKRSKGQNGKRVLPEGVAFIISDILADNTARSQAFGTRSYLNVPGHRVSVKTGTTNDIRDNWAIGYNKDFLVAVWVGNNDNSPMSRIASGITGASPIWHNIIKTILKNYTDPKVEIPNDIVKVNICLLTGTLTCEGCPTRTEYFLKGTEPTTYCSPEWIKKYFEKKEEDAKKEDRD